MEDNKPSHHVASGKNDPAANYSLLSIITHWFGALAVIILFLSHEGEWLAFHVSIGLIFALPLIARVLYRWLKGFPRAVNQHPALNFLSRLVMIGMLVAIFITVTTGVLLPLFNGSQYSIFGYLNWTAPYGGNRSLTIILEEAHDFAGHVIIPLFFLHLVGFAKHIFLDKAGNSLRMLKPYLGGK